MTHNEWYLMAPPIFCGGYEASEISDYAVPGFLELLSSPAGSVFAYYGGNPFGTPSELRGIFSSLSRDSVSGAVARTIIVPKRSLSCGAYLAYDKRMWCVFTPPETNAIYERAMLRLCNAELTFAGLTYPAVSEAGSGYSRGETVGRYMTVGASRHTVWLPLCPQTAALKREDSVRLGNLACRITQTDSTTQLLKLSLSETVSPAAI